MLVWRAVKHSRDQPDDGGREDALRGASREHPGACAVRARRTRLASGDERSLYVPLLIMTLLVLRDKKPVYTTSRLWTLGVFCHSLWRRVPEVATGDLDDF